MNAMLCIHGVQAQEAARLSGTQYYLVSCFITDFEHVWHYNKLMHG